MFERTRDFATLTEDELGFVAGGLVHGQGGHGAILSGGRPPEYIYTPNGLPNGQVIKPGTGPTSPPIFP
jgi:hypothetical protein